METFKLTNESIDLLSSEIGKMYKSVGCEKKEIYQAKLLLEEALIKYQSNFGEDIEIYYRAYRMFGQYRFSVVLRAPSFDPFTVEENPMAFMIQSIMSGFENNAPTWKYHNLENEIVFTVKKKAAIGNLTKLFIFAAISVLAAIISRLVFPADALNAFAVDYIDPISDAYAGLFCVMAVLLTFFSIVMSIVNIGDLTTVGAIGKKIMLLFFSITLVGVAVLSLPLIPLLKIGSEGGILFAAKSIYDIIVGFIPTNIVSPFLNFNSVHIMIIGGMFGFSLLSMGQKGSSLVEIFGECNTVAVLTNGFLNKFIFIYVALKVFSVGSKSSFSHLYNASKAVGAMLIGVVVIVLFCTIFTCIKTRVRFSALAKNIFPATVVCLSSANFGAAFSTIVDSLIKAGLKMETINLTINLGSVFFKPCYTVACAISAFVIASSYGAELSPVLIILTVILSVILVGAMPNIPGAGVSVLTVLYSQIGIPSDGLAAMIAVFALLQFILVAADTWCLQTQAYCLDK